MGKNSWERAREGSEELRRRAKQSSADFKRGNDLSHSTFESSNQSRLGSGRPTVPEPAQPTGGGSLDLLMITSVSIASALGAAAVAKILGGSRPR